MKLPYGSYNKVAFRRAGMGQRQLGGVIGDCLPPIKGVIAPGHENQVYVNFPVAVTAVRIAVGVGANPPLDTLQPPQQLLGGKRGLYLHPYVEKHVGRIEAPRLALDKRRSARLPFGKRENSGDSPLDCRAAVADI